MLVLSRRPGERVVIQVAGIEIVVSIDRVKGVNVRMGFEAPSDAVILREELLAKDEAASA